MRWCFYIVLLSTILAVLPCPAYSAKRVALVIGNGNYQSASLKNPVNDAADMSATLAELGFDVIAETNATKRDMVNAIDRFAKKLSRAEIGMFYYAGHGMQINGRNYLIPTEVSVSTESDVEFEAVDAGRILGKMRHAGNKLNVVILDACRNNPFARTFRSSTHGLARMDAPAGTIVAYATSPGSIAADGTGRNGIYTKHLLTALKKPSLDMQDMFNQAGMGVMAETGNKQIPWTSNTPIPRYYLAGGEPTAVVSDGGSGYSVGNTGSLRVTSTPSGSEVLINDTNVGKTPLTLDRIHTGFMEVRVFRDGYKAGVKEVLVKAHAQVEVDLVLELIPTTGTLTVQTTPADARIRILNIKPVYRPGIELSAGRYHVEVSAEGYVKQETWIELVAGDSESVNLNLSAIQQEAGKDNMAESPKIKTSTGPKPPTFTPKGKTFSDPITGMEFALVKGGCYQMGDTFNEGGFDEKSVHEVCVDDFYMGKYEVTQGQYEEIAGFSPSHFKNGSNYPVDNVSWNDVQAFIKRLNQASGGQYRLPTEAEWEFAARSGGQREKYAGSSKVDKVAWYARNSNDSTHQVGRKRANGLGIYDMSGNVCEWTGDWYDKDYYRSSPRSNPVGPSSGFKRVIRGGSWNRGWSFVRAANRDTYNPDYRNFHLGFRLVLPIHENQAQNSGSIHDNRFIDAGDGTVTDTKTGLMWSAKDSPANFNHFAAEKYCSNNKLGGRQDWRLPSIKELKALYEAGIYFDEKHNLSSSTIKISRHWVWSSETNGDKARAFSFTDGQAYVYRKDQSSATGAIQVRETHTIKY